MESSMADLTAGIGGISNYGDPKVAEAQQVMYRSLGRSPIPPGEPAWQKRH